MLDDLELSRRGADGARRETVVRARARHRLSRLGLSRLAEPARRPHGAGPARGAPCRRSPTGPSRTVCAGRTDAGVHALNQVVHFDTDGRRAPRRPGCAAPTATCRRDIAVQWCRPVPDDFHSRASATRPALRLRAARVAGAAGARERAGRLDLPPARRRRDARRPRQRCSASTTSAPSAPPSARRRSPVKTLRALDIARRGAYWRFDFEANAFLHHMIRNIMGCLVAVGSGAARRGLAGGGAGRARPRRVAAPTFAPDGLYFLGPVLRCRPCHPRANAGHVWLP